jgi:hypothetical protein
MANLARARIDRSLSSFEPRPSLAHRLRGGLGAFALIALAAIAAGCSASDEDTGTSADELSGGWILPSAVAEIGEGVSIHYENPGAWNGGRGCSGKFRDGSRALGRELMTRFGQIKSIGGYACRRNTANSANISVHGTGKALDIFIPMKGGSANSALGDPVANWLVVHSVEIGVQYIIWNRTQWRANGTNTARYTGPVPHIDHIHAEITEKAARLQTPFFNEMRQEGPSAEGANGTGAPGETAGDETTGDIAVFDPNRAADPAEADPVADDPNAVPDMEDAEPGEQDSLGTGVRDVGADGAPLASKPLVGGCAASPVKTSRESSGASLALVLGAALVMRRRRPR